MSVQKVAKILTLLDRTTANRLLAHLADQHQELARAVRDEMFLFEDLRQLDDRAMQTLLREIPQDLLVVALQGCGAGMMEKVLHNLSRRGAEMLQAEWTMTAPQKGQRVESARRVILDTARALEARGVLILPLRANDNAFID